MTPPVEIDTAPSWLQALGYSRYESEDWGTWWEWHGYPGLEGRWFSNWMLEGIWYLFWGGLALTALCLLLRVQWARRLVWIPTLTITLFVLGDCLMAESFADLFVGPLIPAYLAPCWLACWWFWPPRRRVTRLFWCLVALPMVLYPNFVLQVVNNEMHGGTWATPLAHVVLWAGLFVVMSKPDLKRSEFMRWTLGLYLTALVVGALSGFQESLHPIAYGAGTFLPWVWIASSATLGRSQQLAMQT